MQRVNLSYHDCGNSPDEPAEIAIKAGEVKGCTPYATIRIGIAVTIFMDHGRLAELRNKIAAYLEGQEAAEAEERNEAEIAYSRDMMESGADRCPPRE